MTRNLLLTQHYLRAVLVLLMLAALSVQSLLAQNRRGTPIPEGHGKELVEQACTSCHTISAITRSGFDGVEMWRSVQESMMELPESDAVRIAEYLAEHFPAREDRKPTLVDGPVEIDIQEWIVPTLGQRSRDPVEAPDGAIWWTGMWASLVGRLDPVTGTMEEYPLPPEARPHSIVPDDEGYIWYTGNSNGTIGKLDPETGEITEYPTEAGDPHTAVFHPNGKLYFTSQRAAMLGRLDPETGELTEIPTEPRPYGIIVAQNGTVWIAYNGTNKLASMDPESMELRYYAISDEDTRIRRLGIDSKGIIWYVNSTGIVGRPSDKATGRYVFR
ncbi:MAG: cytochrome C, partial [Rhodothermaceae bacterium]|nr:cytochrome C [Rhodothermaceae bacterium]MXZ56970.1 cytochrome C [Rhodothermaceae bacterium]MYB90705.1 cytochrome C [Rhodothermaceae bacterium]MYD68738.1 cytochrome C [Rhodothermaceae bacterium]MYG45327.1 cytochrome C [Rhodothermaceae bacterium]